MFDTLSAEQEKLLDHLAELLGVDAAPDQTCNQSSVKGAIERLYASVGLKPPYIIWSDGPFQLGVMPLLLQLLCFRPKDKKRDDLNIDLRVAKLVSLITEPGWHQALACLLDQLSSTIICSLKYEDEPILPVLKQSYERFPWSRCGVSVGEALHNLSQSCTAQAISCLSRSTTLALSAALTSRLYTGPIDQAQQIKQTVGHVLLREQSLSLRDTPMTLFGAARGSMTGIYKRAQELHEQIAGTVFEEELSQCLAPQADAKFRKQRNLENDITMNTAGILTFGPYDTLWGAWASYSATCYSIIAGMFRDQFSKEVRSTLSDMSVLLRCGFAYTPLTRTIFICKFPQVRLDEQQRLHCDDQAAIEFPDGYRIYAWRGVPVPADVIESPDSLTSKRIDEERNIELRRAFIDKFGMAKYLRETTAGIRDQTEAGTLYLKQLPGDEPIAVVRVKNSTPESDGSFKEYFLRVPPTMKTVQEAIAWTFGMKPGEYNPEIES